MTDPLEPTTAATGVRASGRRAALTTFVLAGLAVLVADQLTKAWALASLQDGRVVDLLGDLLRLRLLHNSGAAFSLGASTTGLLTAVAVAITVGIVLAARRLGSRSWGLGLGLVLGGAVGNLVDRFVRPPGAGRGHVVDFIDYLGLFVGNVADIAIVAGALGMVLLSLREVPVAGVAPADAGRQVAP